MTLVESANRLDIRVNGDAYASEAGATVEGLVSRLAPGAARVAVERNAEIVRRADWPATRLEPGDRVEIVRFVQGG